MIKEYQMELLGTNKKKKGKSREKSRRYPKHRQIHRKQRIKEEFEAMKKKTKKLLLACIGVIAAAVAGLVAYKYMQ